MGEWQPIETAPTDGTFYLASIPAPLSRLVVVNEPEGHFRGMWTHEGEWNWSGHSVFGAENATHWHPLPEPPK